MLAKEAHAKAVNSQIFPGIQGGPLMHVIAAKAVAFKEALSGEFKQYQTQLVANDPDRPGTAKIAPLAGWSKTQVWDYIREHGLPYHALYDRGYTSIGCAPCTRATTANEDERAGRWWWEPDGDKECGLHWAQGEATA